ncbi:MAG: murein L,D-transpeptidase catalytic domain family protein [Sphingomonadaceae bacterium]
MTGRIGNGWSRRAVLGGALAAVAAPALARGRSLSEVVREGLGRHGERIAHRDVVGIADFAHPSRQPRFWLVDVGSGRASAHLVSHGRGSDPRHSGWLERFSNEPGSNASSDGGYLTGAPYVGKHGRSQRLVGLDPANSNAEARAIVIHGAWYVSDALVRQHGKIGRSEGCFAFDETNGSLDEVLARLGPGRLLYAGRFGISA